MGSRFSRVGIAGLGQIGGSMALAFKLNQAPYSVSGFDIDDRLIRAAKRRRMISDGFDSAVDLIENVDILIVALPMFAIHQLLRENRKALDSKILVMDTGSTMQDVIKTAENLKMTNFVGGHPYAGTEMIAPAAWNGKMFDNQAFFLSKPAKCGKKAYDRALSLVRNIGAIPQDIDREDHDRMFAFASGLPHIIAYALVASQADARRRKKIDWDFLAHSFASTTRVAKSSPQPVAQFLWQNRKHLKREIAIFKRKLEEFSEHLSQDTIEEFLSEISYLKQMKDNLERTDGPITSR
ncbi:MAG: prephenate dehydrogenase [Candidatus Zixiibacteriota bacterium]